MTRAHLPLRLFALMLALVAGSAASAPPCLDALAPEGDDCTAGPANHGCEDGCCDEDGCSTDCGNCACCPLRVPATCGSQPLRRPVLERGCVAPTLSDRAVSRPSEGVFRPPRSPR